MFFHSMSSMTSFLIIIFLASSLISIVGELRPWPEALPVELLSLDIAPRLRTDSISITLASTDFGRISSATPATAAVLHPSSTDDIAAVIRFSFSSIRPFSVAARGHGHSVRGQAFAPDGVVVNMLSLKDNVEERRIRVSPELRHVDAGGEQLWIDVLNETLKHGLAPRSWTDYLYLTVGGTLSNAGVSGQAFLHGPQISNVLEVDVINGKGELLTCSQKSNSDLFYSVLGGLGQFGIITRARIPLDPAPHRVKWVRLIYLDFSTFTRDQEALISSSASSERRGDFQYVEGSVMMDGGLMSSWRSSFFSGKDLGRIIELAATHGHGGAVYSLEAAMYYQMTAIPSVDQELEVLLGRLNFIPGFAFTNDVSYFEFLNRVRDGELKLRAKGLWEIPHPWLNLFVPKSSIIQFEKQVLKGILKHNKSIGPILVYPMNKNKWDERMFSVIPDEEIFYSVGLLRCAMHNWEDVDRENMEILQLCNHAGIRYKKYLPQHRTHEDWMKHFGSKWARFVEMKRKYDPKAILSPGQGLFTSPLCSS